MASGASLPDLSQPTDVAELADGACLPGRYGDQEIMLVRQGDALHAIGARCTHAGAPLHQGRVQNGRVLCPFHHAAFDLHSGAACMPPALAPLPRFRVERQGDRAWVGGPLAPPEVPAAAAQAPRSISIVGTGAAGDAAAEMARREGFTGKITLLGRATQPPVDRTKLSKDFLSRGTDVASLQLRPAHFYRDSAIDLRLQATVERIDAAARTLYLRDGSTHVFDKLLLAPGGEPRRPELPGVERAHVLRSVADCLALQRATPTPKSVAIVGGGFIGMEAAAALRRRGCAVDLIAPTAQPLQGVLGEAMATELQRMHVAEGVRFHMEEQVTAILADGVQLDSGRRVAADLVLLAVGIEPRLQLARSAGLRQHNGVIVDATMRSSHPDIYAAGDIARFVAPYSGEWMRLEHWAVAQRQGQIAALAMIGKPRPFDAVPFFWTRHYDTSLAYVGHAAGFEATEVYGDLGARAGAVVYKKGGRPLAVCTLGWQQKSLACHAALAAQRFAAVAEILQS